MANASNIKLGVCTIKYNGTDLGHTKGGVEIAYEPKYVDITADLYGDSKLSQKLVGEKLTAKVGLVEKTLANLNIAIPQGAIAGAQSGHLNIGNQAGQDMAVLAHPLVLHPINEATAIYDVVLYKAAVNNNIGIKHANDGETVIEVLFEAYVDETKASGSYLGLIGDSTK